MNIFLLGVHDKSGNPINIINPTHSFAIIRKNIGEFTGVVCVSNIKNQTIFYILQFWNLPFLKR